MKEKTIYICEICGGSYTDKNLAVRCEGYGNPKHFDEFINKWIIAPIQILEDVNNENSGSINSYVEWLPVRIEGNEILSPSNFEILQNLKFIPIAHTLNLKSRTFLSHSIIKNYLDVVVIVPEKHDEELNQLLVENEIVRQRGGSSEEVISRAKVKMTEILKELKVELPILEGVEKYEYQSNL